MDRLTKFLFGSFPREVGMPYRRVVNSEKEFDWFVFIADRMKPVFTSIYNLKFDIDKVVIDIDSYNIFNSFISAKKLYDRLKNMSVDCLVVFSGRKGFHFYIPVDGVTGSYDVKKFIVRSVQSTLTNGIDNVDTHIFGDIRRLIRVPNTFNKFRYAVPLPDDWYTFDVGYLLEYSRDKKYEFSIPRKVLNVDVNVSLRNRNLDVENVEYEFNVDMEGVYDILRYLLRPCIVEVLASSKNPPHFVRFNMVCELMWLGFTKAEVHNFIRCMHWDDYSSEKTEYYIDHIYSSKYYPEHCNTLKHRGGIKCTRCGFRCWWYDNVR